MTSTFDWFFLLSANVFVVFCLFLVISLLGEIRLSGAGCRPDFSYMSRFSMLFAAGMGIGLMSFGVSEPLSHFSSRMGGMSIDAATNLTSGWAPLGGAVGDIEGARDLAMAATVFLWGLHPWSTYAIVALALVFFSFNHQLPLTLRWVFYPLLGDRIWVFWGHVIDILAVFATLFGLITSLGFGAKQALSGMNFIFGWGTGAIAIISVVRWVDGGVRLLSELNMGLCMLLHLFIIVFGQATNILTTIFEGGVAYIKEFISLAMPFGREDANFSQGWKAFYWAWWISWSPFVGMFIARVSKGRTVRELVVCVVIVPTVLGTIWMGPFGGEAVSQVIADATAPVASVAQELKLFVMVQELPLANVLSMIGIILVLVFFITSADSGSLVIDSTTAGGKENAPVIQKIFWCSFEGLIAIVLLLVGGSEALGTLQAMAVSTGLPFTLVLLAMSLSLYLGLKQAASSVQK
ncbi:MAG: BCCT family transporter [Oceanospirillaceae bacterium]